MIEQDQTLGNKILYTKQRTQLNTCCKNALYLQDCKKANPSEREMPEAHPFLTDNDTGITRKCKTNEELMMTTAQHHQRWIGPSGATRQH